MPRPAPPDPLRQAATLLARGRAADALPAIQRAVRLNGRDPNALNLAAGCHLQLGRPDEALVFAKRAVKRAPGHAGFQRNLGLILAALGRLEDAVAALRRAARLDGADPRIRHDLATALNKLGSAHLDAERVDRAARAYREAAELRPETPGYRVNLARALARRGDAQEATALLRPLAEAGLPDAWIALADIAYAAARFEDARAAFERARALAPLPPEALSNYGLVLDRLGDPWAGEAPIRAALAAQPERASFQAVLANILASQCRFTAAIDAHDRALALAPDEPSHRYNRAHALLAVGRWREGWADYMLREMLEPDIAAERRRLPDDLRGRRVVIRGEQGIGDELCFLRFAPALADRGAELVFAVAEKMRGLYAGQSLAAVRGYEAADDPRAEPRALKLYAGDLPFLLGAETIPPPLPLAPSPEALDWARARLAPLRARGRPIIGVTWRAGRTLRQVEMSVLYKAVPMERLASVLKPLDVSVAVLQRHPEPGEIEQLTTLLGRPVLDLTALNEDLVRMAGVLALLDDYVAVSNTNMHIRESLGGRISRIVVATALYTWGEAGSVSPWFPNSLAYRRDADGGWDGPLDRLARDLARAHGADGPA